MYDNCQMAIIDNNCCALVLPSRDGSLMECFVLLLSQLCFDRTLRDFADDHFCLLPLNGEAIINLTIPMIVSEKPGLEFTPTFDYLEEICSAGPGGNFDPVLLDSVWGRSGQDIVHLPVDSRQIDGCLFILLV